MSISGRVVNIEEQPIEYFTLRLLLAKDSTLIQSTVFRDGQFKLTALQNQQYILELSSFLYENKLISIVSEEEVDIGNIFMDYKIEEIGEVVIRAKQPTFRLDRNKIIAEVSNSTLSDMGNSIDVLKRVPMLIVDGSNNIQVAGKDNALIYIDSRPIHSIQELESLNSSAIEKIEIILNPSTEYDASGHSVISIITKKTKSNTTNVQAKIQGTFARENSWSGNIEYSHRKEKLGFYINYGYSVNRAKSFENFVRTTDSGQELAIMDYMQIYFSDNKMHSYISSFDYDIDKNNRIGLQVNGWYTDSEPSSFATNKTHINNIFNTVNTNLIGKGNLWQNAFNLNYQSTLDTIGQKLSVLLDYTNKIDDEDRYVYEFFENDLAGLHKKYANDNRFSIYSGKMDYILPMPSLNLTTSIGAKYSFVTNNSDNTFAELIGNAWQSDLKYENNQEYNEHLTATYVSLLQKNKFVDIQAGIRAEYVDFRSTIKDSSYIDLFPSILLSREVSKNISISLNYSKRINRPSYSSLNPVISYLDKYTYTQGNPDLIPTLSNSIEAILSYKRMLVINIGYSYRKNPRFFSFEQDQDDPKITKVVSVNYPEAEYYNANVSFNKVILSKISTYSTIGCRFPSMRIYDHGQTRILKKPFFYFTHSNEFRLPYNFTLYSELLIYSPGEFDIFEYEPYYNVSVGLRKSLFDNKLIFNLYANDVFDTDNAKKKTSIGYLKMAHEYLADNTYIRLTLSYNFGNSKNRGYQKKSGDEEEKGRL